MSETAVFHTVIIFFLLFLLILGFTLNLHIVFPVTCNYSMPKLFINSSLLLSIKTLTEEWKDLNSWNFLTKEYLAGLFLISDFDIVFTREKLETDPEQLRMNLIRKIIPKINKERHTLLFKEAHMTFNLKQESQPVLKAIIKEREIIR